jgi:hypothetical protein
MNCVKQIKSNTYLNSIDEFVGEVFVPVSLGTLISFGFFTIVFLAARAK